MADEFRGGTSAGGVTGDVTGLELAKFCQQSYVSVMGCNTQVWSNIPKWWSSELKIKPGWNWPPDISSDQKIWSQMEWNPDAWLKEVAWWIEQ